MVQCQESTEENVLIFNSGNLRQLLGEGRFYSGTWGLSRKKFIFQEEKDKYHMISLYVEYKIWHKWTYLWNRNKLTDIENRFVVTKGGLGGGKDWEFGIDRCKLLYIEWINKALLYSIGNYIQYSVINHNGKEYIKKNVYICTTESLCCTVEINTTL